jgi:hypothetical protein
MNNCLKCKSELLASGLCPRCADPAEVLKSLESKVLSQKKPKSRSGPPQKIARATWWFGKMRDHGLDFPGPRERADAVLPRSDRSE